MVAAMYPKAESEIATNRARYEPPARLAAQPARFASAEDVIKTRRPETTAANERRVPIGHTTEVTTEPTGQIHTWVGTTGLASGVMVPTMTALALIATIQPLVPTI
jgi:hypothetical protein